MSESIQQLLQTEEGKTLEFKRDLSSPQPILRTLVAFANSAGGKLVIGVDDDRQVIGLENPLDEEERLCNLVADNITPRMLPSIELVTVQDKTLLVCEAFPSNSRPHYLNRGGLEQGVLVRLGSTNRQADAALVAELQRSAEGIAYDEMSMPELTREDLDLDAAGEMFETPDGFDDRQLLTLKLLRPEQGGLVPTRGAVLLFGKSREQHFPDAWVQCGRFRGTDKREIFDQLEIHDHLPAAVDSIEFFLKKHAFRAAEIQGMRRRDVWSIPLAMLREAVINALVHADYSQRGTPIRVAFFDDRIDVESPGYLLPAMTIEDMKSGVSRIRNPTIARVFRELGLIEQWGSGVQRIFAEAADKGLPEPEILETGTGIRLTMRLREPIEVNHEGEQVGEQVSEQVSEQVKAILQRCADRPASRAELLEAAGLSSAYMNYKRHIVPLLEAGLIEMTRPDKPTSRLQRYRITAAGRRQLSAALE
ncbi:MAG: AAA family ATPase [Spiribacter salinus]|uniref:AAA family ATPase n=1 Tax=Spiribacter salinus TaxID=1335746 RepID=A0A540VPV7_9GAMM|nr:MAG: AAA family ATPase [Spiribacter salinus]